MNNALEKRLKNIEEELIELKNYCIINIEYLMKLIESLDRPTE